VLKRYAEIRAADRDGGWNLSHNDTWIAATASVTGAVLLTTDRDFERLDARFGRVACIPT
jgi:predicted nucleic acid-binding protein